MKSVSLRLQHQSSPIHVASQGNAPVVELLIAAGCNVNALDNVCYPLTLFLTRLSPSVSPGPVFMCSSMFPGVFLPVGPPPPIRSGGQLISSTCTIQYTSTEY